MFNYTIKYTAENAYENPVFEAFWQFLVTPEKNETQNLISSQFSTSLDGSVEKSINGYNFETVRIHSKKPFETMTFEAVFKLKKTEVNPPKIDADFKVQDELNVLNDLSFKVDFEASLIATTHTRLPQNHANIFEFDTIRHILDNVKELNSWVYNYTKFISEDISLLKPLEEVIEKKEGDSSDFAHLFIAIARKNNVPARFVSGYLQQGETFFGNSKMHAWVEVYIPNLGWIGFDPTNNLHVNHNYVKVAHGKDYSYCQPSKHFLFSVGDKKIKHTVEVTYEQ